MRNIKLRVENSRQSRFSIILGEIGCKSENLASWDRFFENNNWQNLNKVVATEDSFILQGLNGFKFNSFGIVKVLGWTFDNTFNKLGPRVVVIWGSFKFVSKKIKLK